MLLKGKTEKNREKPAYRMLEDVQGEPLKKRDWNRLIEAIETYLKRKLKEEDKRLVMRNTAVAKIIARRNGYKKCPRKNEGERAAANTRSVQ